MKNLREIASNNNLVFIETTDGSNGYPSNIKGAIIGFENYEEAKKLSDRFPGLSIESFFKRDGWNFYKRTNQKCFEPFQNSEEDYGDNHNLFTTDENFYEDEIKPLLEEMGDLTSLKELISAKEEILEEIQALEEGEAVITYEGRYFETIKTESMSFYNDTKTHVIGVIYREK
ncbi:hypothetical protein ACFSTE_10915 [Aquimarina hainanensis]|uniref:Uncharacterized protein n=1 Tax=Aquimarina hainanensis TaxID=1578017 RepID=A0ABW5N881_9FLAO